MDARRRISCSPLSPIARHIPKLFLIPTFCLFCSCIYFLFRNIFSGCVAVTTLEYPQHKTQECLQDIYKQFTKEHASFAIQSAKTSETMSQSSHSFLQSLVEQYNNNETNKRPNASDLLQGSNKSKAPISLLESGLYNVDSSSSDDDDDGYDENEKDKEVDDSKLGKVVRKQTTSEYKTPSSQQLDKATHTTTNTSTTTTPWLKNRLRSVSPSKTQHGDESIAKTTDSSRTDEISNTAAIVPNNVGDDGGSKVMQTEENRASPAAFQSAHRHNDHDVIGTTRVDESNDVVTVHKKRWSNNYNGNQYNCIG